MGPDPVVKDCRNSKTYSERKSDHTEYVNSFFHFFKYKCLLYIQMLFSFRRVERSDYDGF
jgi:hypothetical protein